jgi:hypothetical protein
MHPRTDHRTALRIHIGLLVRPRLGTPTIARDFATLGVSLDVALRVLA